MALIWPKTVDFHNTRQTAPRERREFVSRRGHVLCDLRRYWRETGGSHAQGANDPKGAVDVQMGPIRRAHEPGRDGHPGLRLLDVRPQFGTGAQAARTPILRAVSELGTEGRTGFLGTKTGRPCARRVSGT